MRTFIAALATALLLWPCILLQAQPLLQVLLPGWARPYTTTAVADSLHTKKTALKKYTFNNVSAALGFPAGQKLPGLSKRETDSLQQIILIHKKF